MTLLDLTITHIWSIIVEYFWVKITFIWSQTTVIFNVLYAPSNIFWSVTMDKIGNF